MWDNQNSRNCDIRLSDELYVKISLKSMIQSYFLIVHKMKLNQASANQKRFSPERF